jgi:hypothetical protein
MALTAAVAGAASTWRFDAVVVTPNVVVVGVAAVLLELRQWALSDRFYFCRRGGTLKSAAVFE